MAAEQASYGLTILNNFLQENIGELLAHLIQGEELSGERRLRLAFFQQCCLVHLADHVTQIVLDHLEIASSSSESDVAIWADQDES